MIDWRQQYTDPERDEAYGLMTAVRCTAEEDMAVQGDKDEADINVMLKRFAVTGQIKTVNRQALFGDFSQVTDLQTALNVARAAQEEWLKLPSDLRWELHQDPARLEAWLSEEANRPLAEKLGLLDPPKRIEPIPVSIPTLEDRLGSTISSGDGSQDPPR